MARATYAWGNIKMEVVLGLLSMHLIAVSAIFFPSAGGVLVFVVLSLLTAWVGVGLCYHRLLTHKAFQTYPWMVYSLVVFASLTFQGGARWWVGKHLIHHTHSDTALDPHSPHDGFTWAHVLWLIFRRDDDRAPLIASRKIVEDYPYITFLDKISWLPQLVLACLLFLWGYKHGGAHYGWSLVAWGVGVRTVFVYHLTWFVNSACHTFGYKNFTTKDNSRNAPWWMAPIWLLSGGETFHNNHHAQPASASHGMKWWEFDMTYRIIQVMSWFGLAWDVRRPKMWKKAEVSIG